MTSWKGSLALLGVCVAVSLGSVACGGSDEASSETEFATTESAGDGDLQAGDCYNGSGSAIEIVPCDAPHEFEVVAVGGVTQDGGNIVVGAGGDEALAECLGVAVTEADAVLEERGLDFFFFANLDAFLLRSQSGQLEEAICQ